MKIHSYKNLYKNLVVWEKAMELVALIYELTEKFSTSELSGLTFQMRRVVISIPCNIAEGKRIGSRKDFLRFLLNAYGSGAELETQLEIVKRLPKTKNLDYNKVYSLLEEIMENVKRNN
jgi:four helix bundle protein